MPHVLAASYYSLKGGLNATLMLSNQGPHNLNIAVTLFNLSGARLAAPTITLEGNTVRGFDLNQWAAGGPDFREGSLEIMYTGGDMELGGVVKLVDNVDGIVPPRMKTGDIANAESLSEGLYERVKKAYGKFGYIQYTAEVEPKFHLKDGAQEGVVDFTVTIDEGHAFTIRSITFEGNGNVPEDALQREMLVQNGEVFNKELFVESLKRISQTGQFEVIDADKDVDYRWDQKSPRLDLTIHLKKKVPA